MHCCTVTYVVYTPIVALLIPVQRATSCKDANLYYTGSATLVLKHLLYIPYYVLTHDEKVTRIMVSACHGSNATIIPIYV